MQTVLLKQAIELDPTLMRNNFISDEERYCHNKKWEQLAEKLNSRGKYKNSTDWKKVCNSKYVTKIIFIQKSFYTSYFFVQCFKGMNARSNKKYDSSKADEIVGHKQINCELKTAINLNYDKKNWILFHMVFEIH